MLFFTAQLALLRTTLTLVASDPVPDVVGTAINKGRRGRYLPPFHLVFLRRSSIDSQHTDGLSCVQNAASPHCYGTVAALAEEQIPPFI